MNRFQIDALLREFYWLNCTDGDYTPLVDPEKIEEASVSRIDADFLARTPKYDGATGSLVGIDDQERILLCDRYGFVLTEVKSSGYCRHNEAHWDDEEWNGETVGEALLRLENPNAVHFAVLIHTGYELRNHHSVGGYRVVVYKSPKDLSLKEWVEEQQRRASDKLHAQIADIDAEA